MSTVQLIISDLHLADGTSILDCFREKQQAAFDGLLTSAALPHSQLGATEQVELIINGDCFDFLVTTPYNSNKSIDESIAVQKIDRIIAAHRPFFAALHRFITTPGKRVTFITGNHDLELCVTEVRQHITRAIAEDDSINEDARVFFCPTRFYKPTASLYIEHGNYYDFWNHAQQGIWDMLGNPLLDSSKTAIRPVGSLYFQVASHLISSHYTYFDHFDPSIHTIRQLALLCLFDPELVKEVTGNIMTLLSYPRLALANLSAEESHDPVRLYDEAIQDFAAFQADMIKQKQDWTPVPSRTEAPIKDEPAQSEIEVFIEARAALTLPLSEAVSILCAPPTQGSMEDGVTTGMLSVLEDNPDLRLVVAGHTHHMRADRLPFDTSEISNTSTLSDVSDAPKVSNSRMYFNTSSWTTHYALPTLGETTPELLTWLGKPDWTSVPLLDTTQFLFVKVANEGGEMNAQLCQWQGGVDGSYRVLVQA